MYDIQNFSATLSKLLLRPDWKAVETTFDTKLKLSLNWNDTIIISLIYSAENYDYFIVDLCRLISFYGINHTVTACKVMSPDHTEDESERKLYNALFAKLTELDNKEKKKEFAKKESFVDSFIEASELADDNSD